MQILLKLLPFLSPNWFHVRDDLGLDIFRYACANCDAAYIKDVILCGADLIGVRLVSNRHGPLPIETAVTDHNGN